ncbi:hypothetical protein PENSOL_c016G00399 [Penicillium solitum]|uniref:Uncharacterized protein n=1 Tax=Penicillium solitum TaxID=60172 RepID=A0A1V6R4A8_9EURO|nr:uncharacterized protein PENSOL_c016G00399 [Penicillium solitum]OQD96284.1 hypothetical protein PENSOL_c016G00399 [Penicillium solitum]
MFLYETNTSQENRARTILAIHSLPPRFWIPDHILEEEEEESPYLELSHGSLTTRARYLDVRVHSSDEDLEVTEEDVPWWMQ